MRMNPADETDLEALFETGLPQAAADDGNLFPLPSMPLLEQEIPETPPVGHPTEETGEVAEIGPEIDAIRVGDLVTIPGGKKMKVQWVDPGKQRVGLGKKKKSNCVFFSFAEIETMSGKKVSAERRKKAKQIAHEIEETGGVVPPEEVLTGDYMPDIPINPETGKAWPYPFQMESIDFIMRPKSASIGPPTAPGQAFGKGTEVRIISGPDEGAQGRVFWIGKDKHTGGSRYGFESADGQTFLVGHAEVEEAQLHWGGGLVADEMGLGKTLTAIVCTVPPAVAVVPALLKVNWGKEYSKFRPELTVAEIEGGRPEMVDEIARRADVIVINYDILHSHIEWLLARQNKTVIADEAHYLKTFQTRFNKESRKTEIQMGPGKTSRRTKAFHDLRFGMPPGGRPILLTGTPILNRTKELYPLLYFIDNQIWGGPYAQLNFWKRYCGGHKGRFGFNANGRTNVQELHARIKNIFMVRHTKAEVLTELPPKERSTREVSLSPKFRKMYAEAAANFMAWVQRNGGAQAVARAQRAAALTELTRLRQISAVGKAAATTNYIVEFFTSTQRPLVVMGVHKQAFTAIASALDAINENHEIVKRRERGQKGGRVNAKLPSIPRPIRYGKVMGGMSKTARQKAIDDFQVRGDLDVILYSIHIATGTTLTRSQDMVFFERLWRPADQVQAEDRIHRLSQTNTCKIVYLDGAGTIDAKLAMLLMEKSVTAAGAIDGVDLSSEMASMLVFGEMIGMAAGFICGLSDILDDASALVGEAFDNEDLGSEEGAAMTFDDPEADEVFENPGAFPLTGNREFDRHMEPNSIYGESDDDLDEDGDWVDVYGEEVERLEPNRAEEEVTADALDSWYDPL